MRTTPRIKKCISIFFAVCALVVFSGCPNDAASENKPSVEPVNTATPFVRYKLLVLHSYHPEYEWVQAVTRGIRMAVNTDKADLQCFYMDTKRNPSAAWADQKAQEALEVIGQWHPDAVIAVDDNAMQYIGAPLVQAGGIPVVFCGINADPSQYGYPATNLTGVIERPHFKESVALFRTLTSKQDNLRLVVLSDDSETSRYTLDYMKTQVEPGVEVMDWVMPRTREEWQKAVLDSQRADAIAIYLYHTVLESQDSGTVCEPRDLMTWTVEHSAVPIIGFLNFAVDDGSLCGMLESGVEQGCLAGQCVNRILSGDVPDSMDIILGRKGQSMLNLNTARKLHLTISPDIANTIDIIVGRDGQ
ncbi:MAG TPA: ABC transporter substrate binding protein [Anaerohalosphaeraceae bacterium]|nr:ABC transporter substrate binding protein [Anaerohalosphaeraceae bacterium]